MPAHGWGFDLFIDRPCMRCWRVLEKASDEPAMAAFSEAFKDT